MKTSSKMMFMTMMIMSTILVISSSSWINMWIGLEINLMSFIPLISMSKNTFLSQSTMMYFLIQSLASMMLIMLLLMNKHIFVYLNKNLIKTMIMLTMMMKMGMPPFHMWFPEIMKKMNWIMCFTLMTWQKIAPMYIISMVTEMTKITILVICLSAMVGSIGGMNQTSTKAMMAYSSINHMSWMVSCAVMFKKSWILYMTMYTLIMMMMAMMMYEYNIKYINQMNIFSTKKMEKMTIITLMLSIGGLPPFLGFLPKWIAIQYMISSKEMIMLLIMVTSSIITLAYYLRMTTMLNLMSTSSQKWMLLTTNKSKFSSSILMVNLTLPLFIFSMNFF